MQFTTLSVALFVALATAHQHAAQHFHPRRQANSSATDAYAQTTLTVYAEVTHTITSCAASITNCPADHPEATSVYVVTDTITVDTTICPVTAAESASSAILASYTASAILSSSSTLSTGAAAGVAASSSYPVYPVSTNAAAVTTPSTSNDTYPASPISSAAGVAVTPSVSVSNGSVAIPVVSTSTYFQTDVITITSCAPTVTNCPASTRTTVYPVTTVLTGSTVEAIPTSGNVVLTYTLGTGTSTTVVTTSEYYTLPDIEMYYTE
jgi:hypothetical protein